MFLVVESRLYAVVYGYSVHLQGKFPLNGHSFIPGILPIQPVHCLGMSKNFIAARLPPLYHMAGGTHHKS